MTGVQTCALPISSDSVKAAKMANAFVQAYLDVSLGLKVDPAKQYSTFFDNRSKELRANLERAQAKLSAYQREKGIIANDERFDIENARLGELSTQVVGLQEVLSNKQARGAFGEVQLNDLVSSALPPSFLK